LEDDVRITYHATVLAGVGVGVNSMVGVSAVAMKDVRPFHVNVGIPAKSVRAKPNAPDGTRRPTRVGSAEPDDRWPARKPTRVTRREAGRRVSGGKPAGEERARSLTTRHWRGADGREVRRRVSEAATPSVQPTGMEQAGLLVGCERYSWSIRARLRALRRGCASFK